MTPVTPDSARNRGLPFERDLIDAVRVGPNAVRRRLERLDAEPPLSHEQEADRLLRAVSCLDLTTLAGDDTAARARRLAVRARRPLGRALERALGAPGLHTVAVCVHYEMLDTARRALAGSGVRVAVVSGGFPFGLSPLQARIREIELSVAAGAQEVDVVIGRHHALSGNWRALYDEVRAFRGACGPVPMKVILSTGELRTLVNVGRTSWICMMAGADFIKTSTGKEGVNATIPVALTMVRTIREYYELYGVKVGFKPAGGVSSAKSALQYLTVMKEELGNEWMQPRLFRIGASSLLTDIERQLEHYVTGNYSAAHRHAQP